MKKEVVLITGGSGLLAKHAKKMLQDDYTVRLLTTNKKKLDEEQFYYWDIEKKYVDLNSLKGCHHIIHLAGHPILSKWNKKNREKIHASRITSTKILLEECKKNHFKIQTFICASAIGLYNDNNKEIKKEESKKGENWVSYLVEEWEKTAAEFKSIGSRVVQMRISLIFSKNGGFLKYNMLSMKYGLGIMIGPKDKIINWIHIYDLVNFISKCIKERKYTGPYNLTSKNPISQISLLKKIQNKLYPYSLIIKMPDFITNIILGQRKIIINANYYIDTSKLEDTGFKYRFNSIEDIVK